MEITKHKIHQNFNIQHLTKFCMVYNIIINYYNIPHLEVYLYNDRGTVILKRISKIILHDEIPAEIENELTQLKNIYSTIPRHDEIISGFTLKQMKIINSIYKSLIKKGVMTSQIPPKSCPKFMTNDYVKIKVKI